MLVLLTAALWGATPVAASFSLDSLPPIAVSGLRFSLATLFMLAWCYFEGCGIRLRSRQQWKCSLICGLLLFVQIALFTIGVQLSNSSHTTLLINTYVLWVVAFEHLVTRIHRLNGRKMLGLVVAIVGASLVTLLPMGSVPEATNPADRATLNGDLFLLASALVLAVKIMYVQASLKVIEPGKLIFWHDLIAVVLFFLASLSFEEVDPEGFTRPAVLGLLYQGILVAGFCFAVQAHLLKKHVASQISIFSFSTPLFGLTAAILIRSDAYSPWLLASAGLVALGIWLVQRKEGGKPGDGKTGQAEYILPDPARFDGKAADPSGTDQTISR
ncbi:MAG: DMT family transporter [Pirellulaceae bacterium]